MEYLIAIGAVGALSLAILLWWETRKRIDLERVLTATETSLALVRASRDELNQENTRLRVLVNAKERALREAETRLDPRGRFDRMFVTPSGGDDSSQ
jgi:hypothetical protein